jgi:zinc transport system substrate-binding protein
VSRLLASCRIFLRAIGLLGVLLGPVACRHPAGPKPKVVTSIFPIYDLARRVAGPDAEVIMLEPVAISPHQYNPSPGDLERATGTRLAIMIGLDLDAWMQPMMTRMAPKARVLRLADRVPTLQKAPSLTDETQQAKRQAAKQEAARRGDPAEDPTPNPIDAHVWLDPQRAVLMTRAIGEELCRVDPDNAKGYRARALAVTQSLDALDHELEARTATWKQHAFVTLHDDFHYYAARYHLEVAASVEAFPGVRPSLRYDQLVLRRLRDRAAAAIFGEPQLDSQPAKTLAQVAQIPYAVLDPLGGTPGVDSYEALLRADTDVLEKVLLPPAGPPAAAAPAGGAPSAVPPSSPSP